MEANKSCDNDGPAAAQKAESQDKEMGFFDAVINPPEWLTQDYVEEALRKFECDPKLKITSYAITTCTKPGDNFIGVIFRANTTFTVRGAEKSESFIIKVEAFMEGSKKDLAADRSYFGTEGRMYLEVLPVMQELLKNIGDKEVLAPELVHYNANPKILIFKDIAPEGFTMNRNPVPYSQAAMIARKLGKFHALSYFMREEQGNTALETFDEGMFNEKDTKDLPFMEQQLQILADVTKSWGDDMSRVSVKLQNSVSTFCPRMMQVYKKQPRGQGINVLNHGDFHIRNLMFRFDEQNKAAPFEAIRLIDFQCSVYASPAVDLAFLLYVIADKQARRQSRDKLLQAYHEQFTQTLKDLGFLQRIPTLLDVQLELLRNGAAELFVATQFLSIFHMDLEKLGELDFVKDFEKVAWITFENAQYKEDLSTILPELMYKGIL